jgi:allophanate hydrolase subunit 2
MPAISISVVGVASFQDQGRIGFASAGVSRSGVFDRESYELLVKLLDLDSNINFPVIEILAGSFSLRSAENLVIGIVGKAQIKISGKKISSNQVIEILPNSDLEIRQIGTSPIYLGIPGIILSRTLGSVSYDSLSRLGIAPITRSNIFEVLNSKSYSHLVGRFVHPAIPSLFENGKKSRTLNLLPGIHLSSKILLVNQWLVSSGSRSGIRALPVGAAPKISTTGEITSLPVIPGAIQITPSGEAIILGPDSGVTGGYPIAGFISTAELPRLAAIQAGDMIEFSESTLTQEFSEFEKLKARLGCAVVDMSR